MKIFPSDSWGFHTVWCTSPSGLATEFRSEKIPRNRLGTVFVIPRKKLLIARHSENHGRVNSEARNGMEWKYAEEFREFASIFVPRNGIPSCFLFRRLVRNRIPKFASIFVTQNRISSIFLFLGMVRNRIPRVCFYFCSTAQNYVHFYLFRGTAEILKEQTNCCVYSVFHGMIFCRKLPTLLAKGGKWRNSST
jgi:hypothetical protein